MSYWNITVEYSKIVAIRIVNKKRSNIMKPLWKLSSGKFAGWNNNDILYDASGDNVGYFVDNRAISINGQVIGEMYDDKFIGYRT
jgi:hypothetical protein